ncbi:MAG: SDR family oxidoreductase [Candidatus Rokubacteria bacterium]|nr:SDR family oxidoreductase [Candidatus Rokubacteria bacterium]
MTGSQIGRLAGKVCVITGAGSGIGRAAARLFATEGGKVVVVDIGLSAAGETVNLISEAGGEATAAEADVSDAGSVRGMLTVAVDTYGRVDVLVNNAGYGFAGTVEATEESDWDRLMAVDLKSVYLGCKYVIPMMRRQGGGVIINTASVVALVGIENRAAYCAAKGGVAALTRAMALDHVRDGIRINCVAPGTVDTPYFAGIFASSVDPASLRGQLEARHPMGRLARPEEIAYSMLYLASDESSFCTGSMLVVDGGMSAR